ncbi:hypothetical protein [Dysgonomonas sp. ZJ709]|uniref:hypothetical protein n=1 Tax=Dysgonomonas sp. ZJ709 TaxID=2709797 RepID=UPI0013EC8737|nr:hypothetical protein [Dysgonomonas sp. ZJ709]
MTEEILMRYLIRQTDMKEDIVIESWIRESNDNKEVLEQLYFILVATDKLKIMESVDTDIALCRFKFRLKYKR